MCYTVFFFATAPARDLARARVGADALATDRQIAAVAHPRQLPISIRRLMFIEISLRDLLRPALLLDHPADLPDVVFGQVLDADVS
jgi:hypothetical protein